MSTKRSKVADKKESQGARAAAKEAPSAAKLKLYVPYVFVVEGHCRWEATNPEKGGAYVSLHAAIRALIRQLLDDIVLRDGFDRKALRRARSRLQLDESATTADIILGSICDAESKESETPRSSTQLAMRVMNTFMIACEDAYFRFGIAERIFNEAENGAPADCVEDANDQHCKVRGYEGEEEEEEEGEEEEEDEDEEEEDGEDNDEDGTVPEESSIENAQTPVFLPLVTQAPLDDILLSETLSAGVHVSLRSCVRAIIKALDKYDFIDAGAVQLAANKKRKSKGNTVEDLCVARFDAIVAGLKSKDNNTEGHIEAAKKSVQEFVIGTDDYLIIDINCGYIDESHDKTDGIVLM
jgi:hypothetical protein